ncbi:MAG TPA: inositol monophosphatase family protein [Candidatus Krumholzibacteriaceae bacterium]|nr:inositol monophosphatase family protein [Candidatus Krumholzibacteriaceae bacterium]
MTETPDWKTILQELVDKIHGKVLSAIPKRHSLPVNDFKRLLDNEAQQAIVETLTLNKVSAQLVSEEGDQVFGDGEYVIVADPVDGTTNLARGLQPAVTSISVSETGTQSGVFAGIVVNFYTGETYFAEKGKGAMQDDWPLQTAAPTQYRRALVSMDLSKAPRLDVMTPLIRESRHIRAEGCSAMSLCHVAAGVLDAHVDLRGILRATDASAGLLILREAGGVYEVDGEPFGDLPLTRETQFELVAASCPELMDEINQLLSRR